jgi:hypothetical protein
MLPVAGRCSRYPPRDALNRLIFGGYREHRPVNGSIEYPGGVSGEGWSATGGRTASFRRGGRNRGAGTRERGWALHAAGPSAADVAAHTSYLIMFADARIHTTRLSLLERSSLARHLLPLGSQPAANRQPTGSQPAAERQAGYRQIHRGVADRSRCRCEIAVAHVRMPF